MDGGNGSSIRGHVQNLGPSYLIFPFLMTKKSHNDDHFFEFFFSTMYLGVDFTGGSLGCGKLGFIGLSSVFTAKSMKRAQVGHKNKGLHEIAARIGNNHHHIH